MKRKKIIPMLLVVVTCMAFTGCAKENNKEEEAVETTVYDSKYAGFHSFLENFGGSIVFHQYSEGEPKNVLPEYNPEGDLDDYLQEDYLPEMAECMLKNIDSFDVNYDIIVALKGLIKSGDISELSEEMTSDILSECYQNIQAMGIQIN